MIILMMSENREKLDVVNENDEVVGQETREQIHKEGLLHREIHIWFITSDGQLIFQHRAKDKDTYPDLLTAAVGGHVDLGMSYEDTAVKEMEEETGLKVKITDLHFLKKMRIRSVDGSTGKINNTIRMQYAYIYKGNISDLKIEKGKAIGFEAWPIDKMFKLSEDEKKHFIPLYYSPDFLELFKSVRSLLH
jgi:isopentenyldiphosphate isomerase